MVMALGKALARSSDGSTACANGMRLGAVAQPGMHAHAPLAASPG
jgi:hypothetical protein